MKTHILHVIFTLTAGFGKKGGSKLGSKRVVVDDFDELEKKAASMKIQPTVKQNIVTTTTIKFVKIYIFFQFKLGYKIDQ